MSVILVVDEHGVYRSGLRALIETRVEQSRVAGASSIEGTQASECFDLILIDADCLTQRSLSVLKQVHEVNPATRFAVMSTSNIRADVLNCLCAGFHGFIHKLQSDNELVTAVSDLLSGRIYVPRWFAEGDDNTSELPASVDIRMKRPRLTPRQREILPLLAQGMSNKEIARHLHIAEGTTKIHTAALLQALGARNRTEAAFQAATLVGLNEPFEPQNACQPSHERLQGLPDRMASGDDANGREGAVRHRSTVCGQTDLPVGRTSGRGGREG